MSEYTPESTTAHAEEAHSHEMTYGTYIMVWLGLVALTAITVTIAGIHLGSLTLIAALVIASIKTVLVVTFFMHVKFDNMTIKVFIYVCLLVFIIIMILTFSDLAFR
ncbi:MAG TPA: cytochrome C oxidase subunit IV family protein [Ignavibacteria bacterium]|nr:cytochrome C oxidase subunit IV family protein [Ignavibacteria bacterium]